MQDEALRAGQNYTHRRQSLMALLLASTGFGFVVVIGAQQTAYAQSVSVQTVSLNIPSQNLSSALAAFAGRTGVRMLIPSSLVAGKNSVALVGSYTREQAMSRLLSASNLHYSFTDANTVTIFDPPSGGSAAGDIINGEDTTLLDTITVTAGQGVGLADQPYQTAGSQTYISADKIERFRGTSVGDMLSGTPGVLNADNRNGAALDVNIRGMQGQGRVPVSVDGAIQETTVWRGYSGIAGRSYVDPDFIGGVMVEKGPSSGADGAGAVGGIVRMNTISADDILRPGKDFGIRIKGGFNSNSSSVPPVDTTGGLHGAGTYPDGQLPTSFGGPEGMDRPSFLEPAGGNGSIAAAYKSEYVEVLAAYARRKNGNYYAGTRGKTVDKILFPNCMRISAGECSSVAPGYTSVAFEGLNRYRGGEQVLNTSQDNKSFLLKGGFHLPYDQKLDLSFMRYDSIYGEIMPSQILYAEDYGAYQAKLNQVKMDTYTAKYSWNPEGNDFFALKAGLWMTDAELTTPYQWYQFDDPILHNYYGTKNKRWGFNAENTSAFDTSIGTISLNYGGSYTYETISPGDGADLMKGRSGNRREVSLFTSGEWKPNDWLTFNASVRYSDFKSKDTRPWEVEIYPLRHGDKVFNFHSAAERTAHRKANPGSVNMPMIQEVKTGVYRAYDGNGLAPVLSATIEPVDGIQFYGKYAEAIRLPSLFETTRGFSTDESPFNLKPEHAHNWEFGLNVLKDDIYFDSDKLRVKASYFNNRVDDYLTRTFIKEVGAPIVNIDKAELQGLELSASYAAGRFFGDFSYTHYLRTRFCANPSELSNSHELCNAGGTDNSYVINQLPPRNSMSLTLGAHAFEDKLTVGSRLTYIGKRTGDSAIAVGGSIVNVDWKPYTLVDLFASYKINDHFQVDAAIDNVADVYYMDTLTLGLMPSPGRTFRLNMTSKF
ncbi:TonB-dependent receptor [Brucella sp. BE17]|uniref:TonB-dependent receptor n=1 Tax=Brucella sp. BE17 TaxID=3142977 RepID=UPI0031BBCBB5